MSSYYTTAQLEEIQRARLRQELEEELRQLREQLSAPVEDRVERTGMGGFVLTVAEGENGESGYRLDSRIGGGEHATAGAGERRKMDFSLLLKLDQEWQQRQDSRFQALLTQVEERAVLTEEDRRARERILAELKELAGQSREGMEERLAEASWRLKLYLQAGTPAAQLDRAAEEERMLEYRALCCLAEITPVASLPAEVERECARLGALLEKRRQDAYIMNNLTEIMEEMGCSVVGETMLYHTGGQLFSVAGAPLCDVFVGANESGIMFEPVAESREGSLERRRQIERSANNICAMYAELEERAARRGIMLRRVYQDPAVLERICARDDVQIREEDWRRKAGREKSGRRGRMTGGIL